MSNKVKVPGGAFYAGDGLTVDQTTRTVSAGGGSSVSTPDWNQNDATASDYIKNRPGGYEGRFEITWDGDTTGRVSATMEGAPYVWYKVSDKILTMDQIIGGKITFVENGESVQDVITNELLSEHEFGIMILEFAIISKKSGVYATGVGEISIPEPGIYFVNGSMDDYSILVSSLSNIIAYPFDDKYIPDTIARKAELDSRITEKEVILTSSTTDSTKKFKITVNDSGTLTATEITE